MSRTILVAGVY